MPANQDLHEARRNRNDEFYTQWNDIQKEVSAYIEYNPDVFKGKTILLPCDDPEWSNFTKFFCQNFGRYGLKKLISTSFAADSKNCDDGYQTSVFEFNDPKFDENKTRSRGKIFTLTEDMNKDGRIDYKDLQWDYMEGDGDFKSDEVKNLRNEADVIITNPPFSLFREFVAWIMETEKEFLIIGNMNAVSYSAIFPLIKENKVWLGPSISSGDREFGVPKTYPLEAANSRTDDNGNKFIRVKGVRWFTNLEHGRLHEKYPLMTEADVIKFSTKKPFERYDNYDAIEVSEVRNIPSDYRSVMGVPITFLDKHNPDQFEIIGITKTWFGAATKIYPKQVQVSKTGKRSEVTKLNDGAVLQISGPINKTYYEVDGKCYEQKYARLLIRNKELTT